MANQNTTAEPKLPESVEPSVADLKEQDCKQDDIPHFYPHAHLSLPDEFKAMDVWDRVTVLAGGVVFGFCLGFSAAIVLLGNDETTSSAVALCCVALVVINTLLCFIYFAKTQSLIKHALAALESRV